MRNESEPRSLVQQAGFFTRMGRSDYSTSPNYRAGKFSLVVALQHLATMRARRFPPLESDLVGQSLWIHDPFRHEVGEAIPSAKQFLTKHAADLRVHKLLIANAPEGIEDALPAEQLSVYVICPPEEEVEKLTLFAAWCGDHAGRLAKSWPCAETRDHNGLAWWALKVGIIWTLQEDIARIIIRELNPPKTAIES